MADPDDVPWRAKKSRITDGDLFRDTDVA